METESGKENKRKGSTVKKSHLIFVGVFLLGVVLAPRVRSLPLLDKLPSF